MKKYLFLLYILIFSKFIFAINITIDDIQNSFETNNYGKTIELSQEYRKYHPENLQVEYILAKAYYEEHNYIMARKYLLDVMQKDPITYAKNNYEVVSLYSQINLGISNSESYNLVSEDISDICFIWFACFIVIIMYIFLYFSCKKNYYKGNTEEK